MTLGQRYGEPMTATPAPQSDRYNPFAIVAIITVWFAGIFGLIFGYIALSQIKSTGEKGHGIALASVILGWIAVGIAILMIIFWTVLFGAAVSQAG